MEVYNVQPARVDIRVTKGDTFNISFRVQLNGAPYGLEGKQMDMAVMKFGGAVLKTLSSVGALPEITIDDDLYSINCEAFADAGTCKYDLQVTDGTNVLTIQKGYLIIDDEVTV